MYKQLILNYINNIKKEDISSFSLKQNITLTTDELDIIYNYIKNESTKIINDPQIVINEIKDKVSQPVYNKILELYDKYKMFLN